MKTITSVSGGQSSAYIAANYPADFLVFALVCIEGIRDAHRDRKLVQKVSDKIGQEFVATAEDDMILHTMFDLEQYLGQQIDWVTGSTFDDVTQNKGGWAPNKLHRYCTVEMKAPYVSVVEREGRRTRLHANRIPSRRGGTSEAHA